MKAVIRGLHLAAALGALALAGPSAAAAEPCSCAEAVSPAAFKRCVRDALRRAPRGEPDPATARSLRRLAARASCGKASAPKRAVACCLPLVPAPDIVTGRMCASITSRQCAALGGIPQGDGAPCAPTPCGLARDIPVAHTPPGGYGTPFPPPVLAGCTEPLVAGAPDLRGMWETVSVEANGVVAPPSGPPQRLFQRIEQCGDRLVVTAGGVIHDMRCDGTVENGVDDVAELDFTTRIRVVASYENGVHVLRPVGVPIEVTRRLEGDTLVWSYLGRIFRLRRIGGPDAPPPAVP